MLNDAKCELIYNGFNECSHPAFSGFIRIDSDDTTLLGSPLCSGNERTVAIYRPSVSAHDLLGPVNGAR